MQTHYYAWKNNEKRAMMYKRECHIVARGAMNSILIEFADGQRECVSRHSVRRLTSGSSRRAKRPGIESPAAADRAAKEKYGY